MVRIGRIALLAAGVAAATISGACLNDRDSLYMESLFTHDTDHELLKAIVGWFPVHSPLYYRLRIRESLRTLATRPAELMLYDDVAVAYERLGDDMSAIRVIESKRAFMVAHGIKPHVMEAPSDLEATREKIVESSKDPWYRYYANAGTFWVHRWVHEGMPAAHKKEWLGRAKEDIDTAIRLNPLAHGLREFAQAKAISWMLNGKRGQTLYEFAGKHFWKESETVKALGGLVELGGAWESPDVFATISQGLAAQEMTDFAYVAFLRADELQKEGKRSATGHLFRFQLRDDSSTTPRDAWTIEATRDGSVSEDRDRQDYAMLRTAANQYRKSLADYETPLLLQGKHPDSMPGFWANYREPAFPDFKIDPAKRFVYETLPMILSIVGAIGLVLFFWGLIKFVKFLVRRDTERHAKRLTGD